MAINAPGKKKLAAKQKRKPVAPADTLLQEEIRRRQRFAPKPKKKPKKAPKY